MMHLNTQIIAKPTLQLTKSLKCSFDHPFTIIEDKCKPNLFLSETDTEIIVIKAIESELLQKQQNVCYLLFNIPFRNVLLQKLATKLGPKWERNISQFDPRIKNISYLTEGAQNKVQFNNYDATFILQFFKSDNQTIRLYFLPTRLPTHPNSNSRAIQQSFKLCRVLKSYLSLEYQTEQSLYLEDNICLNLSQYLYLKNVSRISFILKLSQDEIDKRILQKVGEIKLPQEWLEKQEYRKKKQQIYCLYRDQQLMLKNIKKNKSQVLHSINQIRKLTGLKEDKYEDINVQTLRKLKAQGLNQKLSQVKELEIIRAGLEVRLKELENRRQKCQQKKSQIKKLQVKQMLNLKNEVLTLQAQQSTPKYSGTQRFIYNRSKPAVQTRLITTIFSRANKKLDQNSQEVFSMNKITNDKSNMYDSELEKQNKRKQTDFKFAQKKVATVIKQGSTQQKFDMFKIREDYQNQIINIDFQIEKKLLAQLNKYEKATTALQRLLQPNQNLNLESM